MELAPSLSRSSSAMSSSSSSLSSLEEEEFGRSQSSEPSLSPTTSRENSNTQESRAHSPNSSIEISSTSFSSNSDDGEAPDTEAAAQTQAHTQPMKTEDAMSQHKDSTLGLTTDDVRVWDKSVEAICEEDRPEDSPLTLPPTSDQDYIESDREAEFEKTSSLGRAAARQKAEQASLDGRSEERPEPYFHRDPAQGATCAQDGVIENEKEGLASKEPKPTAHESSQSNNAEDGGERSPVELKIKVEPRVQASWVQETISACKENKKTPLREGDLLIVLDLNDYSKSCLIDSRDFCKASDLFAQLYTSSSAASQGCASEQGLTSLLVLSGTASTPGLHPMPLDCPLFELTRTLRPTQRPNIHQEKAEGMKIKHEGDRENAVSIAADQTGKQSIGLGTDWPKACDSLLRSVFARQRAHGVSRKEIASALPQIEGILSIAQKYGLADQVQSDFDSLFLDYVGNGKFWQLIAQEPVRCLKIGVALKKLPVYEEAFKHLVGSSANSKAGIHFDGLPDEIQAMIQRRSRELYHLRRDVNEDLLLISLAAESPCESIYPSSTVSQHNSPDAYSTVNIVRDWMAEHIGYLRDITSRTPPTYYLCDHECGCDTVAGFYRAIAAGREAYLSFDAVWDSFDESFLQRPDGPELDSDVVELPLEKLKAKASDIVSGLVKSTLHLPGKDGLDYLTCVTVGLEDVPWDVSGADGESEDEDGG